MRDNVIIYSHPRSGLHLLSLGLYGMTKKFSENDTYSDLWASHNVPSYDHFFTNITPEESDKKFKKHILLLRDYKALASTSRYTDTQIDFHMIDGRPEGLDIFGYTSQIHKFESLKSSKMVLYYEDLISSNNAFIEAINFIGINHDLKTNFTKLREQVMKLYCSSGHSPSIKKNQSPRRLAAVNDGIKNNINFYLYEKYLSRYNNKKEEK